MDEVNHNNVTNEKNTTMKTNSKRQPDTREQLLSQMKGQNTCPPRDDLS